MNRPIDLVTGRELSDFEIEHGYAPCVLTFGSPACGVRAPDGGCDKTFDDCKRHDNAARFGGFPLSPSALVAWAKATKDNAPTA